MGRAACPNPSLAGVGRGKFRAGTRPNASSRTGSWARRPGIGVAFRGSLQLGIAPKQTVGPAGRSSRFKKDSPVVNAREECSGVCLGLLRHPWLP